jgi:hypothetical protein
MKELMKILGIVVFVVPGIYAIYKSYIFAKLTQIWIPFFLRNLLSWMSVHLPNS